MSIGYSVFLQYFFIMGFKENLKTELVYTGMLVKELAAKTGINKYTIDNYLSTHNCTPSAEAAVKIAQVLGVSVEYLVTGHETRRKAAQLPLSTKTRALVQVSEELDDTGRDIVLELAKSLKAWQGKEGAVR
jgi:transcriptional regulator with XRE-family HTH domain